MLNEDIVRRAIQEVYNEQEQEYQIGLLAKKGVRIKYNELLTLIQNVKNQRPLVEQELAAKRGKLSLRFNLVALICIIVSILPLATPITIANLVVCLINVFTYWINKKQIELSGFAYEESLRRLKKYQDKMYDEVDDVSKKVKSMEEQLDVLKNMLEYGEEETTDMEVIKNSKEEVYDAVIGRVGSFKFKNLTL